MVRAAPRARPALHPDERFSWLDQVERFFAQITELEHAIVEYLRAHNQEPRPFVWTRSAEVILNKVRKLAERLAPEKPATDF